MTYTAQKLHELTAPLFARHPSAKPEVVNFYIREPFGMCCMSGTDLIIQGHLTEWLLTKEVMANNGRRNIHMDRSELASEDCRYCANGEMGHTLLEALIAACMEVPTN